MNMYDSLVLLILNGWTRMMHMVCGAHVVHVVHYQKGCGWFWFQGQDYLFIFCALCQFPSIVCKSRALYTYTIFIHANGRGNCWRNEVIQSLWIAFRGMPMKQIVSKQKHMSITHVGEFRIYVAWRAFFTRSSTQLKYD